jgi:hypothetical protein
LPGCMMRWPRSRATRPLSNSDRVTRGAGRRRGARAAAAAAAGASAAGPASPAGTASFAKTPRGAAGPRSGCRSAHDSPREDATPKQSACGASVPEEHFEKNVQTAGKRCPQGHTELGSLR